METVVKKWGNSLAIRIPSSYAKDINIHDGSIIDIEKENNKIVIKQHKNSLKKFLDRIDSTNIHSEINDNGPIGNEVW